LKDRLIATQAKQHLQIDWNLNQDTQLFAQASWLSSYQYLRN